MKQTGWIAASVFALLAAIPAVRSEGDSPTWRLRGDLNEACTCSVPCSCNFGEGPSPNHFCWALFSLGIEEGSYGDIKLDGLRLAGANGPKGAVMYVDESATPEQTEALKKIARTLWLKALKANGVTDPKKAPPDFRLLGFRRAKIEQVVGEKSSRLRIGPYGGYENTYILGLDGKTPVVVENNWSWNIQHGIKGKTKTLAYKDAFGNRYSFNGTNANQGKFDWSDSTPIYFR